MDGQNYNNGQNNGSQDNVNQSNSAPQNNYYQGYPPTAYYQGTPQQRKEERTNGIQVTGLVFGILSLVTMCCYISPGAIIGPIGLVFAIVGLICSIVGNRRSKSGVGIAGLVCSIVGLVFNVILVAILAVIVKALFDIFSEHPDLLNDPEFLNDTDAIMEMLMEYFGR